tara:strand:- start:1745 stop:2392 length:648 start_codon:yes stop_codon:yes gene_type:complete
MKYLITLCIALLSLTSYSQETTEKQKEVGIAISRFSFESIPFDFIYKVGNKDKFWRFEAGRIDADFYYPETGSSSGNNQLEERINAGLSFRIARENRKAITDKFTYYHGIAFGLGTYYGYSQTNNKVAGTRYTNHSYSVRPSLGYSIGGMFNLSDNLYLNFDLTPSVYHSLSIDQGKQEVLSTGITESSESIDNHSGINFTQGAVKVGIFYRIGA